MSQSTLTTTPVIAELIRKLGSELAKRYGADFKLHVTANDEVIAAYDAVALIPPTAMAKKIERHAFITLHQRIENVGWTPIRMGKVDSLLWSAVDKSWIATLLDCGDETLITGDQMYQVEWVAA